VKFANPTIHQKTISSGFISIVFSIVIALFTISAAISVPILVRPFYYMQISTLELENQTGYSYSTIKNAYDEMVDYCVGLSDDFGTGELLWSADGYSHFTDVRTLFLLDLRVLIGTSFTLLIMVILKKRFAKLKPRHFRGHTPAFYSAIGLLTVFCLIVVLAASDFNRAFVIFHHIFFPGKDNWLFNSDTDQIIKILPEQFFANCGIIIVGGIILMCAIYIMHSILQRRNMPKKNVAD